MVALGESLEGIAPVDNLMGDEPENSEEYTVETDTSGQKWRVYKDGRRLKSGHNQSPGRPKKEVREMALRGAVRSVEDDLRIMHDPQADQTQKERAKDRLYRYGLGTADETTVLKSDEFIKAHARACADCNLDVETMLKLTEALNRHMGLT